MLEDSGYSVAELQDLWNDQVLVQTRPLVSARAGLAKAAIQAIMKLITYQRSVSREIAALDRLVKRGEMDADDAADRREELIQTMEDTASQIRQKRAQLGVTEKANLKRLEENKYLKVCPGLLLLTSSVLTSLASHAGTSQEGPHSNQGAAAKIRT